MKILLIFLPFYLYVNYLTFLPMVMHMHIKRTTTFGNWLMMVVPVRPTSV